MNVVEANSNECVVLCLNADNGEGWRSSRYDRDKAQIKKRACRDMLAAAREGDKEDAVESQRD